MDDTLAKVHLKQVGDLEVGSTDVNYLHQSCCSNIFGGERYFLFPSSINIKNHKNITVDVIFFFFGKVVDVTQTYLNVLFV